MTVLTVLENETELFAARDLIAEILPDADLLCFGNSLPALAAARSREIDVAVLDTKLTELSGIDFGQYLQDLYPYINLIYLSEDKELGYAALNQHASGYLLKPASRDNLQRELDDLRHPADGKPVAFRYTKTKEIVALLINNRGAQTTNGEIIATLWEDDGDPEKKASYLSNLRQDLQNTFTKLKLNGIILKQRGSLAIAKDRIECDLYDWLENKLNSKYQYLGDYMNQYSWPETVHAELDEISYSLYDD